MDLLFCPFSLLFAALWSWKRPLQLYSQHYRIQTFHFPLYLQHFGGQTCHVAWDFVTRVQSGLVYDCFSVYLGLVQIWRSEDAEKQGKAEKQAKSREAEQWRSREVEKQRSEEAEK